MNLYSYLVPIDELEGLAEFVREEVRPRRDWGVSSLSGGQSAVILIMLVPTHPGSTVGTHQGTGGRAQETTTRQHLL